MEKTNHTIKIKMISLLLFTNITVYLFASSEEVQYINNSPFEGEAREGYALFKVKANLFTLFEKNTPITILSEDKLLHIPFAILKEQITHDNSNSFSQENSTDEFIIYLPDIYISPLMKYKKVNILPYGKNYKLNKKKVKRTRTYEITI